MSIFIKFLKRIKADVHNDLPNCLHCGKCSGKCRPKAITVDIRSKKWQWNDEKCGEHYDYVFALLK